MPPSPRGNRSQVGMVPNRMIGYYRIRHGRATKITP
jgi:hypothetical protein